MSCTNCNDSKIPLALATGADGRSVYIAFASDALGNDFSYTPSDTLPYISFVSKIGSSVTQAEFTTWVKYHGEDGTNGLAGVSVTGASIDSEGNLILTLSDASTINAGNVTGSDCCTLTWNRLGLLNGWVGKDLTLKAPAEYAIDGAGFIHFRGIINSNAATSSTFANIALTNLTQDLFSTISDDSTASVHSRFDIEYATASLKIANYASGGTTYWLLDSIPPIFIR